MGKRLTISLGRHVTVFQAKIYAILACVYEIQMNARSEHDINICADSHTALEALWAAKRYIHPPLCRTLCVSTDILEYVELKLLMSLQGSDLFTSVLDP
jgi:hypothetical protein